jgi:protein-S-isoprenylcysteine O-methyltransferase Ste14
MNFPDIQDNIQDITALVQPVNYAQAAGINSFPLALIFTCVYVPLLGTFVFKAIRNPTYVLWITAFFCQVRIVSFAMRALLAKSESAAGKFDLVLAEQIIYGVGFFGILYSAYIMVINRQIIKGTVGSSPLSRITENLHLIRLALVAAVSLSITGSVQANTGSQQSTINTGKHLKTIAIIIFLVVAALLVVQTVFALLAESGRSSDEKEHSSLAPHGLHILLLAGLLLLVREVFLLATNNKTTQYEERLFYPFEACTELAAVILFLAPGLIPLKRELAEASRV